MNGNELRSALCARQRVYGTLSVSSSPEWVSVITNMGLDCIFIDTEHITLDRAQLSWICQAYNQANLAPMVRIPSPDPYEACKVLDGGAKCIIAPYVETEKQVRDLVGAVKYKPLKGKLLEKLLNDGECLPEIKEYVTAQNAGRSLLINVESVPAIQNLDALLNVPGLDGILIGPHDLSVSLGVPEQWTNPVFVQAVDHIITAAKSHNRSVGIHVIYEEGLSQTPRWVEMGANIIIHQADLLAFKQFMKSEFRQIRSALGDEVRETELATHI